MKNIFLFSFTIFFTSNLFSQTKKENLTGQYVRFENDSNNKKEIITINNDSTYEYDKEASYDLYYGDKGRWNIVNDTLKLINNLHLTNDFNMDTTYFRSFIEQFKQKYLISKGNLYSLFNDGTPYLKKK